MKRVTDKLEDISYSAQSVTKWCREIDLSGKSCNRFYLINISLTQFLKNKNLKNLMFQ